MDYSRVILNDAAARVLTALQGDLTNQIAHIESELAAILANPNKSRNDKHVAALQHQAAQDALQWALEQAARYYTPVGG